jgi:hypothetical protein
VIGRAALTYLGEWKMRAVTFKATIKLKNGAYQEITVQADTYFNAKVMIEALYGNGSIFIGPIEVR